ncbi:pimeloyl-ACP methyl ester carboxylesterase [Saccharopolyspora lacisalsi]|uniref:Pimeloyl-ACP methyl ester carboxylesterase n=1 Tax=Halosaccharopolyspora lacisalsi TaxID=1000566 RepID=A0A839DNA1_9PSEU|nr:alpha/beta fold hydrolase [Halosaccharopolyspora lacisalsi]MBA8822984.1 pimeloyl-ACP methyl ester carboxylesterase [Halosaccharopolyspora lacisalsi]
MVLFAGVRDNRREGVGLGILEAVTVNSSQTPPGAQLPRPRLRPLRRRGVLPAAPLSESELPAVDTTVRPAEGRLLDIDTSLGREQLFVREKPGPDPLADTAVFLHGLAGSSSNWTDLGHLLGSRMRTVAVDLPGFGFTEPPEGFDYTHHAHAEIVIGLLEHLDAGELHLVGNSFGGAVAVEVAARRPDLVATLTLISPAVPDLRPSLRRISDGRLAVAYLPLIGARARRQLAATSARERVQRLIRLCFADPDSVPANRVEETVEEFVARDRLPWAVSALASTTHCLIRSWLLDPSLWSTLRRVEAPTLVVWGERDRVMSVRKARRTARELPRGRLLVLSRTGHVAQMERPSILARAVLGMCAAVRAEAW